MNVDGSGGAEKPLDQIEQNPEASIEKEFENYNFCGIIVDRC